MVQSTGVGALSYTVIPGGPMCIWAVDVRSGIDKIVWFWLEYLTGYVLLQVTKGPRAQ